MSERCESFSTIKCPNDLACRRYVASIENFHHIVSETGHFMPELTTVTRR